MNKLAYLLVVCSFSAGAADLNINSSTVTISDTPSRMGCDGLTVSTQETTSCCIGNTCNNLNSINLLAQDNQTTCPRLVIDGYVYDLSAPIDIHHGLLLFITQSGSLANCTNGSGGSPTLGSGFLAVINADTLGVQSASIDVDEWVLQIQSVDGDVICDGGTLYDKPDLIFRNSFE